MRQRGQQVLLPRGVLVHCEDEGAAEFGSGGRGFYAVYSLGSGLQLDEQKLGFLEVLHELHLRGVLSRDHFEDRLVQLVLLVQELVAADHVEAEAVLERHF